MYCACTTGTCTCTQKLSSVKTFIHHTGVVSTIALLRYGIFQITLIKRDLLIVITSVYNLDLLYIYKRSQKQKNPIHNYNYNYAQYYTEFITETVVKLNVTP